MNNPKNNNINNKKNKLIYIEIYIDNWLKIK